MLKFEDYGTILKTVEGCKNMIEKMCDAKIGLFAPIDPSPRGPARILLSGDINLDVLVYSGDGCIVRKYVDKHGCYYIVKTGVGTIEELELMLYNIMGSQLEEKGR